MQKVTYTEKLENDKRLLPLAQKATEQLEELIGLYSAEVSAEWDLNEDAHGRPLVSLRIRDYSGAKDVKFDPAMLANARHTRGRLNRLWGDLLEIRSDAQHRKVLQLLQEYEGA